MCRPYALKGLPAIIILTVLLVPCLSRPQITFVRAYGAPDFFDEGRCVQQTSDGGYIIAGWGGLNLMKVDSMGDSLWSRLYAIPGSTHVRMSCVRQTADDGYILAGWFASSGDPDGDAILMKTDSLGYAVWSKTFGGDSIDASSWVDQTLDGGYIAVGYTIRPPDNDGDIWLIRTDSLGDTLWTMTYGDTLKDYGRAVQQTSDGGYIITGGTTIAPGLPPSVQVLLLKTDSSGNVTWSREYGPAGLQNFGNSVQETSDGGYTIAGTVGSWGGNGLAYLIKTDSSGDSIWSKTFLGKAIAYGNSVQQTFDGGYVVAGTTTDGLLADPDVYLIKTDDLGNVLWDTTYSGEGYQFGYSVWHTSDSGYVVAGRAAGYGVHFNDVYLIKTDKRGWIMPEIDYGVVSLDSPPDTVFPDSFYEVMATVHNYGNVMDSFVVSVSIDGCTDTLRYVELDPGSSIQVHFVSWLVPSADSTAYAMTVCTYHEDDLDTTNDCRQKTIFAYSPTGIEEGLDRRPPVVDFRLWQNEPNPFSRSTAIRYSLPVGCAVSLIVYDITGRVIETLVDERQQSAVYQVHWDGTNQANGIYFYRLIAGDLTTTRKMTLIK